MGPLKLLFYAPGTCKVGSSELGGFPVNATQPNPTLCQPCLEPPSRSLAAVRASELQGRLRERADEPLPFLSKHLFATPLDAGPLSTAMQGARPCNGSFEADTVERMHNVFTPPMWRGSLNFFFFLVTLSLSLMPRFSCSHCLLNLVMALVSLNHPPLFSSPPQDLCGGDRLLQPLLPNDLSRGPVVSQAARRTALHGPSRR